MDSSYNNQYSRRYSSFSIASVVLGAMSILTWLTGVFPLLAGGLGIIFAMLTYRSGQGMPSLSKTGLILSCLGVIAGIVLTSLFLIYFVIPMFTDPAFYRKMKEYYESFYGINLDELLGSIQKGGSL